MGGGLHRGDVDLSMCHRSGCVCVCRGVGGEGRRAPVCLFSRRPACLTCYFPMRVPSRPVRVPSHLYISGENAL